MAACLSWLGIISAMLSISLANTKFCSSFLNNCTRHHTHSTSHCDSEFYHTWFCLNYRIALPHSTLKPQLQKYDLSSWMIELLFRVWFYVNRLFVYNFILLLFVPLSAVSAVYTSCSYGTVSDHLGSSALINVIWFDLINSSVISNYQALQVEIICWCNAWLWSCSVFTVLLIIYI